MDSGPVGKAIIRLYNHARNRAQSFETVMLGTTIKAARYMDFAERIRRRGSELSHEQIVVFASFAGLDENDLRSLTLPTLQKAGVLDFIIKNNQISVQEYVGVSAPILTQVATTWEILNPSLVERCALASIDLSTAAPLRQTDHQTALSVSGFSEETQKNALTVLYAIGILQQMQPDNLDEAIIYNEYVWGDGVIPIAQFLANLPTNEREILTSISTRVMEQPGIPLVGFNDIDPTLINTARKVGFLWHEIQVREVFHPCYLCSSY